VHRWSWTVIECCWVAWLALWVVLAFFAKRTVYRPGGAWSWTSGIAIAVFLVLRRASGASWDRHVTATPVALQFIAVVLVVVGLAFCVWARVTIGANWSGSVVLKDNHELIQSGPYALVRHPIYTGMLTMALGTALDFLAAFSFAAFGILLVAFVVKSRREEQLMAETFPEQYSAYRARVKALIPFVV
jgi:protein-S-isoprenylcysteine O-methyltransferase Ste14